MATVNEIRDSIIALNDLKDEQKLLKARANSAQRKLDRIQMAQPEDYAAALAASEPPKKAGGRGRPKKEAASSEE